MKVLVVEDFADAANLLQTLLRHCGYDSRLAVDGEQALNVARDWEPDVILMDVGLPRMDGYEISRRLRNGENFQGKIFLLSGFQSDEAKQREAGVDGYLMKPYKLSDIQALIDCD